MDQERKRQIERTIEQAQTLKAEAEAKITQFHAQIGEVETRLTDLDRRKIQVDERRKAVHEAQKKMQSDRLRLCMRSIDFLFSDEADDWFVYKLESRNR